MDTITIKDDLVSEKNKVKITITSDVVSKVSTDYTLEELNKRIMQCDVTIKGAIADKAIYQDLLNKLSPEVDKAVQARPNKK